MKSRLVSSRAFGLLAAMVASFALPFAALAQTPPNILLVILDDVGVDLLGFYNQSQQEVVPVAGAPFPPPEHQVTPKLEDLAERGLIFRNVWATPLCMPTRTTILSGNYGYRTGVITLSAATVYLPPEAENLVDRLKSEPTPAYTEAKAIGKWHISPYNPYSTMTARPVEYGFTAYEGEHALASLTYRGYPWFYDDPPNPIPDPVPTYDDYLTTKEVDAAIAFVQQPHTGPWFLWLALHAAHAPWTDAETPTLSDKCSGITNVPRRVRCRQLEVLDAELGRLFDAIELQTTTVFVVGDNGSPCENILPGADIEQIQGKINRGCKKSIYEGGINVPLIVAGAGVTVNGSGQIRERATLIHASDIHATIQALAGVPNHSDQIDGSSFRHVLNASAGVNRTCVYTDGSRNAGGSDGALPANHDVAVRNATHKLIRKYQVDGVHDYEFYDLVNDPGETIQLPETGATFDALLAELAKAGSENASPCKPANQQPPPCGLGAEAIPALLLVAALRRARRFRRS